MKRSRKARPATLGASGESTGRYGAIDFIGKTALLSQATGGDMDDHVYRVIEIVGTSERSIEDAVNAAISRAVVTMSPSPRGPHPL